MFDATLKSSLNEKEVCVKFVSGNWPDITRRRVAPESSRDG